MIIAWSIFHGLPVGNFFGKSHFNGVVYDGDTGMCETCLADIPDQQLREKISKVHIN